MLTKERPHVSIQEHRKRLITEQKAQLLAAHNAVASSRSPIAVRSAVSSIGAMQVCLSANKLHWKSVANAHHHALHPM